MSVLRVYLRGQGEVLADCAVAVAVICLALPHPLAVASLALAWMLARAAGGSLPMGLGAVLFAVAAGLAL